MPAVTVIVPVYNGMPYIEKCLESLVNQTLSDLEIIVINDGSTDDTQNILAKYENKYGNVRVVQQKNRGLYETRKRAVELATGSYVGWVDADDFVDIDMYRRLYETAIQNDSELVYCDYYFYPKKIQTKEKWYKEYQGKADVDFIERNNQPWNKLVKREILEQFGIAQMFPECFDEAYIKVLINAKNIVSIKDKLYYYRVGNGSMSSSYKNIKHYERFIKASIALKENIPTKITYWQEYFIYRIIYYTLMTMLVSAHAENKKKYIYWKRWLRKNYPEYAQNMHIRHILSVNFGKPKAFAILRLVPCNYYMAKMLGNIALGNTKAHASIVRN